MSFEPQKVIEFDKGKQIGQTLTQHADNIPYEDTTVGAELDSINTHLSGLNTFVVKVIGITKQSPITVDLPTGFTYQNCIPIAVVYNVGSGYGRLDERYPYLLDVTTNNKITLTPFNWDTSLLCACVLMKVAD
jgi:hypothetical protein